MDSNYTGMVAVSVNSDSTPGGICNGEPGLNIGQIGVN